MADTVAFDDEWVSTIYENCAATVEALQAKEGTLSSEEQGLQNLCEVVVYLYDELYETPVYGRFPPTDSDKVLH